jgi:hypothetical protein
MRPAGMEDVNRLPRSDCPIVQWKILREDTGIFELWCCCGWDWQPHSQVSGIRRIYGHTNISICATGSSSSMCTSRKIGTQPRNAHLDNEAYRLGEPKSPWLVGRFGLQYEHRPFGYSPLDHDEIRMLSLSPLAPEQSRIYLCGLNSI